MLHVHKHTPSSIRPRRPSLTFPFSLSFSSFFSLFFFNRLAGVEGVEALKKKNSPVFPFSPSSSPSKRRSKICIYTPTPHFLKLYNSLFFFVFHVSTSTFSLFFCSLSFVCSLLIPSIPLLFPFRQSINGKLGSCHLSGLDRGLDDLLVGGKAGEQNISRSVSPESQSPFFLSPSRGGKGRRGHERLNG